MVHLEMTPLFIACEHNKLDVVKLLARARGINVNQCKEDGWSPLHAASQEGHAEVVSVLLAAGSDVHLKTDGGATSLDLAIYFKQPAASPSSWPTLLSKRRQRQQTRQRWGLRLSVPVCKGHCGCGCRGQGG
jgi:hypothetical protein